MLNKLKYQDTNKNFIKTVLKNSCLVFGSISRTAHESIHPNI